MTKNEAAMHQSEIKGPRSGHSVDLKKDLMVLGQTLQARPSELRGPFKLTLSSGVEGRSKLSAD